MVNVNLVYLVYCYVVIMIGTSLSVKVVRRETIRVFKRELDKHSGRVICRPMGKDQGNGNDRVAIQRVDAYLMGQMVILL